MKSMNKPELDAIRTILTSKLNEQSNNRADQQIQADPKAPSGNQPILNQPKAERQADTPSPRTRSNRKQQEPNPANPDNAGEAKPTGDKGTGSDLVDSDLKRGKSKTLILSYGSEKNRTTAIRDTIDEVERTKIARNGIQKEKSGTQVNERISNIDNRGQGKIFDIEKGSLDADRVLKKN